MSVELDFVLWAACTVKYVPDFVATMPAAPAIPDGASRRIEYALSPTPLTEPARSGTLRMAMSNPSFGRFRGPMAAVSVPSFDEKTQALTVKPTSGSSSFAGDVVSGPMTASTSEREATAHGSDDAAVPGAALLPADDVGAAEPLAVAEDALAPADALALTAADGDAELTLDDPADAVAELVPRAAGEPLEPPVVVEG